MSIRTQPDGQEPKRKVSIVLHGRLDLLIRDIRDLGERMDAKPIDQHDRAEAQAEMVRRLRREADALDVIRSSQRVGKGGNNRGNRWGKKARGKNSKKKAVK